jgi:hypothetical protein
MLANCQLPKLSSTEKCRCVCALQANVVGVFWELEHYPHKLIPRLPSR